MNEVVEVNEKPKKSGGDLYFNNHRIVDFIGLFRMEFIQ